MEPLRPRQLTCLLLTVLALALALGSCADQSDVGSDLGGAGDASAAGDGFAHGEGDAVVVQVAQVGGLRPVGADFRDVPDVTLLGDGRLVLESREQRTFPGPAIPPLVEVHLAEGEVQEILALAEAAGLLEPAPDYGRPPIADATTTVVNVTAEGETVAHEVYALAEGLATRGISAAQQARRERVADFVAALSAPSAELGTVSGPQPFTPHAFAVVAHRVAPDDEPLPGDAVVEEMAWPLPDVDLAAGECLLVTGDEAARLAEVLSEATVITRFVHDEQAYTLAVRPLLPDEDSCADVL